MKMCNVLHIIRHYDTNDTDRQFPQLNTYGLIQCESVKMRNIQNIEGFSQLV